MNYMDEKDIYNALLEELYYSDRQLAAIYEVGCEKRISAKVDVEVEKKAAYAHEQAKRYGQPIEASVDVVGQYGESLGHVGEKYTNAARAVLVQNAGFNRTEINNLRDARKAQLDIIEKKAQGIDYSDSQEMLDGCKMLASSAAEGSKASYENAEAITEEGIKFLDEVAEDKQLTPKEDKNRIAKIFSNLFAKFGGKAKFEQNVINPIHAKATDIEKNRVLEAEEKVKTSLNDKIKNTFNRMQDKIKELGGKVSEKLKEIDVKKVVQSLVLAATGTATVLGIYSPINFGLDLTAAIGSFINDLPKKKEKEVAGPSLA